jgi:UDP-N-acetylmuramoyl-tripeptide--D-alanyl-D-alanine ligase
MAQPIWTCTLQDLATATGGQIVSQPHLEFSRVGTDTRSALDGKLFIALKGENHNAHDFVAKAVAQRARVILVHEWREEWSPLLGQASFVRVTDTLPALQALARFWRKKQQFKIIAITGSNGKTSTKEFTYALMKNVIPTYANKGSFNNHWGLPLSILEAGPEHKFLVLEMGMNKLGEIWKLCQIAEPDIVTVTTVGRAHMGMLGSQVSVAQAKEEIYVAAPKAIHVFNIDNEWTMRMQSRSHSQQITFSSFRPQADVHFRAQRLNWDGLDLIGHIKGVKGQTWVHVLGRQNTNNLMCASALACAAGIEPEKIWAALGTIQDSAWGRNQLLDLKSGGRVLFDAYNANPDSMQALLKNLYEMEVEGRKFLLVADMGELGSFSQQAHEEAGERAAAVGFESIWYVGEYAEAFKKGHLRVGVPKNFVSSLKFDPEVSKKFVEQAGRGDLIAAKGSRSAHLEQIVESWPLQKPLGPKP